VCLGACPGSDSGHDANKAGAPAAGSGGDGAPDPDAGPGDIYKGDAGEQVDDAGPSKPQAGAGGAGGKAGSSSGAQGGDGSWSPAKDVEPAECRPDPTDFTACGGDITGQWRRAVICFADGLEDLRERLMCPELEQEFSYHDRMLIDFKSSGNYSAARKSDALQEVTVPKSCISESADCSELGDDDTDNSDGDLVTIRSSGDNCVMKAEYHAADSATGTWEISGSQLTLTDADGPNTSEFCVRGNTFTVKSVDDFDGEISWGVFERP
jgi:hypothetical protein